ncbi:hypothetical protein Tco_1390962 [Tanacetum coccineum]
MIKVRTKVTGQNEGIWGFEHIRGAFEKDVIPFVKSLRDSFTDFELDKRLEKPCISLEIKIQQCKESFQNDRPCENQDSPKFQEFFKINELKAQLQKKNTTISNLKKHIENLKGKNVAERTEYVNKSKVIVVGLYKLDLEPLSSKLRKNKEAHVNYLKVTKENADTLRDIVEQARASMPSDNVLDRACMYAKQI